VQFATLDVAVRTDAAHLFVSIQTAIWTIATATSGDVEMVSLF
jgi:hypothetical protein